MIKIRKKVKKKKGYQKQKELNDVSTSKHLCGNQSISTAIILSVHRLIQVLVICFAVGLLVHIKCSANDHQHQYTDNSAQYGHQQLQLGLVIFRLFDGRIVSIIKITTSQAPFSALNAITVTRHRIVRTLGIAILFHNITAIILRETNA